MSPFPSTPEPRLCPASPLGLRGPGDPSTALAAPYWSPGMDTQLWLVVLENTHLVCPVPQWPSIFSVIGTDCLSSWGILCGFFPVEFEARLIKSVFKGGLGSMWLFQWSPETQHFLVSWCWQLHFSGRTLACLCFIYVGLTRWHSFDHWKSTSTHQVLEGPVLSIYELRELLIFKQECQHAFGSTSCPWGCKL